MSNLSRSTLRGAVVPLPDLAVFGKRPVARPSRSLVELLLDTGALTPANAIIALSRQARKEAWIGDILIAQGLVRSEDLLQAQAQQFDISLVDPIATPPDTRLIDAAGLEECLKTVVLPWKHAGGTTLVATSRPDLFSRHRPWLEEALGPVSMVLASRDDIQSALMIGRSEALNHKAETLTPEAESCRSWAPNALRGSALVLALAAAVTIYLHPVLLVALMTIWATLTLFATIGLKLAAALSMLRPERPETDAPVIARLPTVSVIVPLLRERDIAPRLIRRLGRLEYPRELLDIILVIEGEDRLTAAALSRAGLPTWMRVLTLPRGSLKTKPRALNFALDFCRGSIIGIYDAEDAPDPDQINKVAQRFHERGKEVACLQGVLDFYNPRTNWLSRCFTMEYAAWFRIVLPGLERLGMPIPLGGTTVFFRREALEKVGGWDAHNVTEDADLGMRLARHGYRTEFLATVTEEEACCRSLPWIRQRSRWLKGYMMTWAVHMRSPALLWRQLGARRFFGMQVLFLGSLSQYLLAPLLWSFWLIPLGMGSFLANSTYSPILDAMFALFIVTEAINLSVGALALRGSKHRFLIPWIPTLHIYFPLGSFAAYKALWELFAAPFYWDKTHHGLFDGNAPGQ